MARKKSESQGVDLGTLDMQPVGGEMLESVFVNPTLGIFAEEGAVFPTKATEGSACFDLSAFLRPWQAVNGFNGVSRVARVVKDSARLFVEPGDRLLIPTGLYFDIPERHVLKVYSRSGLSFKMGLILTNSVGIIDSDYVEQVYVSLTNITGVRQVIESGDRIAQAQLCEVLAYDDVRLQDRPQPKTSRTGGFGSTGK